MKSQSKITLAIKAVAVSALLALPAQMNGATIFQADFSGTGTGTGGATDVVQYGGTGAVGAPANGVTNTIETTPTMGQGNFLHVVNASTLAGGQSITAVLTPAATANSWAGMQNLAAPASTVSLNGGMDLFVRPTYVESPALGNWFRPLDFGASTGGNLRLILAVQNGTLLRVSLLGATGAFTNSSSQLVSAFNLDVAYTLALNTVNHIAVGFSTDTLTNKVTMGLYAQSGTGSMLSSAPLGSVTFTINSNVVTAGLPTGATNLLSGTFNAGDSVIDYDAFRMYNSLPTEFAAIPEPGTVGLIGLGMMGLLIAARRRKA